VQYSLLNLEGLAKITPKKWLDARGHFFESFKANWFSEHIADVGFVQENQSLSIHPGTIRGLHFQLKPFGQGKLVSCLSGAIFDVVVDIRPDSKTYGQWEGVNLNAAQSEQLWVPEGFAHGYCTLAPDTVVSYKVTNYYSPEHERGLAFADPDLAIDWPIDVSQAIMSDKDIVLPRLRDLKG